MKELIRPAGEVLLKFLESEQGRKALGKTAEAGMAAAKVAGEGLGKFGLRSGLATESAVLKGAPVARDFAEQFVGRQGVVGKAAKAVSSVTDDQITKAAGTLGAIANPVSQAVAVGAPLALARARPTPGQRAHPQPPKLLPPEASGGDEGPAGAR